MMRSGFAFLIDEPYRSPISGSVCVLFGDALKLAWLAIAWLDSRFPGRRRRD